jgi:hypothetical protein
MRFLTLLWELALVVLALMISNASAQGTFEIQQSGGMEALIAREFSGLMERQATNLQVGLFILSRGERKERSGKRGRSRTDISSQGRSMLGLEGREVM